MVAVTYPLLDVLLLTVAVRLLIGGLGSPAQRLLGLWLTSQLAADAWYAATLLHGSFRPGHPVIAGWLLSFGFLGAAALHPSMCTAARPTATPDHGGRRGRLATLTVAGLSAPAVLVVESIGQGDRDAVASQWPRR
jgi:hypothetical protein